MILSARNVQVVPVAEDPSVRFEVRAAKPDDLGRLREVFRRSSLSNVEDRAALIEHPEALVLSAATLTEARVQVATVEPALIVGLASTVAHDGFLELVDLFTDPDWMRRGVATTLINDVVEFAATIKVGRISVIGNPHALDFYRRVGFVGDVPATTDFGQGLRMHLTVPI
jgi:GNAT superfamily N-acetyltransferase